MKKIKGVVKSYDFQKKYGFIEKYENREEIYFFHVSNLVHKFKIEPSQTEVLFIPSSNEKGLVAVAIEEFIAKVTGKFSCDSLSENELMLTNADRLVFLEKQSAEIERSLNGIKKFGIDIRKQNGRMIVDAAVMLSQTEPGINGKQGHLLDDVPAGYRNTARYLANNLQKQLDNFNRDYIGTSKGIAGEQQTQYALKVVTLEYPVLHNVRFEMKTDEIEYSAESDTIVITDKAIFVIETKNYGSKRDTIYVSSDGAWTICDNISRHKHSLPNPYKQSTDHIFALKKFFKSHGIQLKIPVQPIIAIANNDVVLRGTHNRYASVMRVDMIGTYILEYLNKNPTRLKSDELLEIKNVLSSANLPPKEYKVIDYHNNIQQICKLIKELHAYWTVAEKKEQKIIREQKEQKEQKIIREQSEQRRIEEKRQKREGALEVAKLAWNIFAEWLY